MKKSFDRKFFKWQRVGMKLARELMKHPELVSEIRHTIPRGAELNQLGQEYVRRITENPFPGVSGLMTHHVVIQATSKSGKTTLDPDDLCIVGLHWKDQGGGIYGSSREWRTSPVLLFFEHKERNYAYTCSGSLYELGQQVGVLDLVKMVPSISEFLK